MKRITTSSGTQYLYDEDEGRIQRLSNVRPIKLVGGVGPADNQWDRVLYLHPLEIGESMHMTLSGGDWRISTPVTQIEEVEADYIVTNHQPALAGAQRKVTAKEIK